MLLSYRQFKEQVDERYGHRADDYVNHTLDTVIHNDTLYSASVGSHGTLTYSPSGWTMADKRATVRGTTLETTLDKYESALREAVAREQFKRSPAFQSVVADLFD